MSHPSRTTLPGRINTATRKQHAELNRLLMHRLPLALPPHQTSPLLLAKGLIPFAQLFFFFESEWHLLEQQVNNRSVPDVAHHDHVRTWLATLRPEGLARSGRLQKDLKHLRLVAASSDIDNSAALGEAWLEEMRLCVREKPHLLVAFAWVFYMATFSGGRWIRQQMANAGAEFWSAHPGVDIKLEKGEQQPLLELPGFSFLSFEGDQDGEDIKAAFKERLAHAEALLTPQEQQEVIDMAGRLFDCCLGLGAELDQMVIRERAMSYIPVALLVLLLFTSAVVLQLLGLFPEKS